MGSDDRNELGIPADWCEEHGFTEAARLLRRGKFDPLATIQQYAERVGFRPGGFYPVPGEGGTRLGEFSVRCPICDLRPERAPLIEYGRGPIPYLPRPIVLLAAMSFRVERTLARATIYAGQCGECATILFSWDGVMR